MKRDRKAVRDSRITISVNEYEMQIINRILDITGGEMARLIHEAAMTEARRILADCEKDSPKKEIA